MAYTKTAWVNDSPPAINATNLNKIEQGIEDSHDQLVAVEGGECRVNVVAASGATETLPAEYAVHKVTMDQNCTFTFPTPTADGAAFRLDLSGAYTPTFPAAVDWPNASAPTYQSPSSYAFSTNDGGTTWFGTFIGGGYG